MATTTNNSWLEIDIKGFAQILRNKGIARIALEPISNAFDTDATEITVTFTQSNGMAQLTVTDDDPNGFADLRDAYMLFAPSNRREDPTKRGRFGQGEKELIAVCFDGGFINVCSTTGTISFDKQGRSKSRVKTQAGTVLHAEFRCNKTQAAEFAELVRSLIVPDGVKLTFNGEVLQRPAPINVVRETLPTKIVDDEGNLADTRRQTDIELYEPAPGETAYIYELGVPVVEHDGRWHVNVMQKVPLNTARDNVTPSYLRRLREIMLNETYGLLSAEETQAAWVTEALPASSPEALQAVVQGRFGEKSVVWDPSDTEASKRALDKGYNVIRGNQFTTQTWSRIREHGTVKPAGQIFPSGVPTSPDGVPPIPKDEWTDAMRNLARYTRELGHELLGFYPEAQFSTVRPNGGHSAASWGGITVTFYLGTLGFKWPVTASQEDVDAILIHEFTHEHESDHFTTRFYMRLGELGAKLRSCKAVLR